MGWNVNAVLEHFRDSAQPQSVSRWCSAAATCERERLWSEFKSSRICADSYGPFVERHKSFL